MRRRTFLSTAVLPLAGCRAKTANGYPGYAFVACAGDGTVAAIDLATFKVVQRFSLGGAPTALLSHRSRYVVYALTPSTGTVHEISTRTLRVERKVAIGGQAYAMGMTPANTPHQRLWILGQEKRQLVGVELKGLQIEQRIPLSAEPAGFDVANWLPALAVSYGRKGTVAVIDSRTGKQQETPLGGEAGAVRFQSNGEQFLAANMSDQSMSILRSTDGGLVTNLPLVVKPEQLCEKPDGGEWYVSGPGADAVVLVDPYKTQISATLLAGNAPGSMASCTTPPYLFVANPKADSVSVMDIEIRKIVAVAEVGREPGFVAVTPNDQYALVLNRESGDVAVLDIPTLRANKFKMAALLTMVSVGERPVSAAVQWRG